MRQRPWLVIPTVLALVYLWFMVIAPWTSGIDNLFSVWYHWQTFNAAMIALLASIIALYAARYQEKEKRLRELLASRAVLPEACSRLASTLKEIALIYNGAYARCVEPIDRNLDLISTKELPETSEWVITTIRDCIKVADDRAIKLMSDVFAKFQVTQARLRSYSKEKVTGMSKVNLDTEIVEVTKLYTLVMHTLEYARGNDIPCELFTKRELINSMLNLNFDEIQHANSYRRIQEMPIPDGSTAVTS